MEDQLIQVLANTQKAEAEPRMQAELELRRAKSDPRYGIYLANIASHTSVDTGIRQSALSTLRLFIEANWSIDPHTDEPQIPIADENRETIRQSLLDLCLSQEDDRKVKIAASYAIGKIAVNDFPEQWPTLLPTILNVIPNGNDAQLHGALRVLGDLVDESLSEDQFFSMARDIARTLTEVATNESRKPILRALAISVFRGCFDLMNMVKEDHNTEVTAFAEELLKEWNPFFISVLKTRLPEETLSGNQQPTSWNAVIALKLQVVKTLLCIRSGFSSLLLPHSTTFFSAVWEELTLLVPISDQLYIQSDAQGRLEDSDHLQYTLDFLVLEEIDFLNQCFRASPVQKELDSQLKAHASAHEVPWMMEIMKMLVGYSRITREEEDLWDIDCSLFLAEETSVSANYTPRIAAGDLLIKMGEWINQQAIDGLYGYTKTLFASDSADWRSQEAALYLFVMVVGDFLDTDKELAEPFATAYLELVDYAIGKSDAPLLRARGYLVAGILGRSNNVPATLVDRMIATIANEESEVVSVSCVKALEGLIVAGRVPAERQIAIINAIQTYLNNKDASEMEEADELVVMLTEALRSTILMNSQIVLAQEVQALDMLFLVAKLGANNFQVSMIVSECFGDVVHNLSDPESYNALCTRTLPILTGTFDAASSIDENPLVTIAIELLAIMIENAAGPLPAGFVAAALPKITRLLMESSDGDVLRPGCEAVKFMLKHDHQQVINYQDENGRSGVEVCLHIVDRLLGPSIEDYSVSEVGGLAAEIVEMAGHERLGPFLPQLLQAVANRLATARTASSIQSLIIVFARLSLNGAQDVVEFLSQIQINGENGLQVVMAKWLENSIVFAGYDEIRQNVIALSKLYTLNDARLAQVNVQGDLIPEPDDGRIKTRSRAKQNPDKYTSIPATLKIVKVLLEELASASGQRAAANAAAAAAAAQSGNLEEDDGDEGWEDDDNFLELGLASTKAELMSFIESGGQRERDDETEAYLTEFFIRCGRENVSNFQDWYGMLSEEEQGKLNQVANAAQ